MPGGIKCCVRVTFFKVTYPLSEFASKHSN